MRILFLSRWFPYPANNGSKIRIFNILRQLSQRHDVVLLTFADESDRVSSDSLGVLREYCSDIQVLPYRPFRPSSSRAVLGLFSSTPRSLVDTRNDAMAAAVSARTGADSCDLVVASEVDMVPYVREAPGVPALLEDLELTAIRDRIQRVSLPHRRVRAVLTWLKLAGYVRCVLPRFSACTVVSNSEAKLLKSVVPDYPFVRVIPNAVNLSDYGGDFGQPSPGTMVFAGAMTYSANYDAVGHFLKDIYPRIARGVPNASLRITGSTTGVDVGSLPARQGVTFTGHVDDVRPVVARSWLSVVPLRVGGGTRLKILESMALGTPVVSTTKGAEGLEVTNGENIAVADPPDLFADCAIELMQSAQLRARLTAGGRALVESRYSWAIVGTQLNELVEQVGSGRRPNSSHSGVCGVSVG